MQSSVMGKPTVNSHSDLNGLTQTTLPDPNTHSDTKDDPDTDSDTEDTEMNMGNGNTLANHIPLEVHNNTTVPEVTTKIEIPVESVENQNAYNEQEMGRELTKPLEIDTMTGNAKIVTNGNSTNIAPNCNLQVDDLIEDMGKENTGLIDEVVADEEEEGDDPIKEEFEIDIKLERIEPIELKTVIEIKKEPLENIVKGLEDLGEDFTVSVLDIEDPFVSIEISESSDDEDENMNSQV